MSQPNKIPKDLIIIGIDPGIADTGYAIVKSNANKVEAIDYGSITTKSTATESERLLEIQANVEELIQKFQPSAIAIEKLFFNKNVKTALSVGQARGIVLATAQKNQLEIYEFTPGQVKQSLTGTGSAPKKQVQEMVKRIFNLKKIPQPDDAADALAIANCCANSIKLHSLLKK